jgi:hypothetical protein
MVVVVAVVVVWHGMTRPTSGGALETASGRTVERPISEGATRRCCNPISSRA